MNYEIEISIICPVYKSEAIIDELVSRVSDSVSKITSNFEIILIEDGSQDKSWEKIQENCLKNEFVKGIKLSRNFGQHFAISAGLENCKGKWIIVMDCDLQDVPEEIPNLYNKAQEGYYIVHARRKDRQDSFIKKLNSRFFYKMFSYLTETKQDAGAANFGIYHQKVIKEVIAMGDYYRVFPILVQWVGFKRTYLDTQHDPRKEGRSNYTFRKLISLAFNMIVSFSDKPLRLCLKFGILTSGFSFAVGLSYLFLYLFGFVKVAGYTSIILLISFNLGITTSFIGILGIYIGKMSIQIKNRQRFIIEEKIN
jgi:dolichol-phosphate mannosyltransferase